MPCFQYRIFRNDRQVLTNWLNADNREDAIRRLETVKDELNADTVKVTEVFGNTWRCKND